MTTTRDYIASGISRGSQSSLSSGRSSLDDIRSRRMCAATRVNCAGKRCHLSSVKNVSGDGRACLLANGPPGMRHACAHNESIDAAPSTTSPAAHVLIFCSGWHVLTVDHIVLPATHTFIHTWNELSCLYSAAAEHDRASADTHFPSRIR